MTATQATFATIFILLCAAHAAWVGWKMDKRGGPVSVGALPIAAIAAVTWQGLGTTGKSPLPGLVQIVGTVIVIVVARALAGTERTDPVARGLLWFSLVWALVGGWLAILVVTLFGWLGTMVPLWVALALVIIAIITTTSWHRRKRQRSASATTATA